MHDDYSKDVFERFEHYLTTVLPSNLFGISAAIGVQALWDRVREAIPDIRPPIVEITDDGVEMTWKNPQKSIYAILTLATNKLTLLEIIRPRLDLGSSTFRTKLGSELPEVLTDALKDIVNDYPKEGDQGRSKASVRT